VGAGQAVPQRLILLLLLSGCGGPRVQTGPVKFVVDRRIAERVASVDAGRVQQTIEKLAAFRTRNSCSGDDGILAAEAWLKEQLGALGLRVEAVPYQVCSGLERHSVMAVLPGADPRRVIVVGGHYDSRSVGREDGEARSPGANDSGSQTAVVLEAARVLAHERFAASLAFVAFGGEEQGLLGSKALVEKLGDYFPGAHVEAVLNCDIVGGDRDANAGREQQIRLFAPGTPREIKGPDGSNDDTSPSRNLQRTVLEIGRRYVPELQILPQLREDRVGRGGDHSSFVGRGIPAVRFIEAAETLAHQHSPDDTPDRILPGYAGRVARLVVASAAMLASAPPAPRWEDVGRDPRVALVGRRADELGWSIRSRVLTDPARLGLAPPYWVSAVAVDGDGHESLPAYPELRCDGTACTVPADALDFAAKN
jgi:hypothetical protein